MSATNTIKSISLSSVSDRRKDFLRQWRVERHFDLLLRANSSAPENSDSYPFQEIVRPFDIGVKEGDVRLLQMNCSSQFGRLLYVAVLYKRRNGTAVVAPFSRYGFPATKDEWLTGFSATPLLVLQLWNALPVPLPVLHQSWRVERFSQHQLATAQDLYGHALRGTWPRLEMRNDIGLAILDPDDERLVYQEEELDSLAPLRNRLYGFIAESESLQHSKQRLQKEWRIVARCFANQPMPMAASSDDNICIPITLFQRMNSKARSACDLGWFEDIGDQLDIEVNLKDSDGLPAGRQAKLYVAKGKTRQCYSGVVTGEGNAIRFNLASLKDRVSLRKATLLGILIFPK